MRTLALLAAIGMAFSAQAFAQDVQTAPPAESVQAPVNVETDPPTTAMPTTSGHTTEVYHGAHRYPAKSRGRAGDPRIVDHSADTLIVEPTRSTITISPPPR